MKKILSWLLLATFVISTLLLAACGDAEAPATSSEAPSTEESNVSEDTSSKEEEEEIILTPVRDNPMATVVSLGKTYTCTATAGEKYPDSYGSEMTDGKTGPATSADYNDETYTGYHSQGSNIMAIVIDLGEVYETLYRFTVGYLSTTNAGLAPPDKIKISVSEDGDKYVNVGEMTIPEFVEGCRLEAELTSDFYAKGRYVRFTINKNAWLFLDECTVIADVEQKVDINELFAGMVQEAYTNLGTVSFTGGKAPDMSLGKKLISKGKNYTLTGEIVKRFPNAGSPLTDGKITELYSSGKWVGVQGGESATIVVDLGEVRTDLYNFALTCYANFSGGDCLPVAVTYAVSEDGENFTDIGRVYAPTCGQSVYDYPLSLSACATGRYVRFTVEATETEMYLMEEAVVYVREGKPGIASLYPELTFDSTVKEWENPSTQEVNLLAGKIQQVYVPVDAKNVTWSSCSAWNLPVLTDGWKANPKYIDDNHIHNNCYFKFQSASAAMEFYFDLGATSAVKTFTAQFTHRMDWGVQAPADVTVYLSMDGETWYTAGVVKTNPIDENTPVDVSFTLEQAIQARFVCFSFLTCNWCGISEFETFGTTATDGAVKLEESGLINRAEDFRGYMAPSEDVMKGNSDLCLLYQRADRNNYDVNTLLPYLAYLDTEGNIKDTMFDSFLFLMSGNMPSGRNPLGEANKTDLEWVIDDMFEEGYNLTALEEAAGMVKDALNLPDDFKYGFMVTIYDLDPEGTNFGDIDGDGKTDATNTWEKRVKAIEWYMQAFEDKYAEYSFENIEFVGYYWYREGVYPEDDQPKVVSATADLARARGYCLVWIPWYCAPGVSNWQDYKFDAVCMQPNYVFDPTVPEGRLEQAARLIRSYGISIEIEIGYSGLQDPLLRNRYLEYLAGGDRYGYMKDAIHMYYQEITVYYDAAKSGDPKVRAIYDYTYQFIKGTLDASPEAITVSTETAADTPVVLEVFENAAAHLTMDIVTSPDHGSVTLGNDGIFTYYPEAGFTGTVTFTFTYNEGLGDSEICTATITVG